MPFSQLSSRATERSEGGPGPILRSFSTGCGVWVPAFAGTTTQWFFYGAFGPALTNQSAICAPVQNSTSFFFLIFSKILRKYLARCGAPMM